MYRWLNAKAICYYYEGLLIFQCQTGAARRVLPRSDLLFVAYMDVGKGREQDAEALLGFYLAQPTRLQTSRRD